ncbi:poly-gamma-glutamate synthase PgsB [Serpentinicella sp. ANB-PHB4]|uniref:poly-gamma-glutamate synthase PgsB n=1 Tax=Serpentinicella sp. ANB-PHB4 TaxID=3074076 RepID=UPI0028636116|nr:poly-gamma-glutamate synthase PgsB [Serpentinicella sp. ANB-PHB4]MDR5658798.1 poly-gamma-glutamate synthase PgsB [Serpentinicella sp. ANB-PHB4]
MGIILLFVAIILILGYRQKKQHRRNLKQIPLRLNINGVRGKSTATRLTTAILQEAGIKAIGKTTGTAAMMNYWFTDVEKPILRGKQGPNIGEQIKVVAEAASMKAEALVSECMAVQPDYQIIFQNEMVQANLGVIVNVLEDHMEVLGPTLDEVAEAFLATIPYKGKLVVTEGPYLEYFKKVAKERETEVFVAKTENVSEEYLRKFDYILFPENVAIGLAVAEALGIDESVALQGMLNAKPDPGALKIMGLGNMYTPSYFVNGFAANDAASTLSIWNRVEQLGYTQNNAVVIMNCRYDRVDRTEQFAKDVLPYIKAKALVVIGGTTRPIIKAFEEGNIPIDKIHSLEGKSAPEIMKVLKEYFSDHVIFGIGNIHGVGEPLVELLEEDRHHQKESTDTLHEKGQLIG